MMKKMRMQKKEVKRKERVAKTKTKQRRDQEEAEAEARPSLGRREADQEERAPMMTRSRGVTTEMMTAKQMKKPKEQAGREEVTR